MAANTVEKGYIDWWFFTMGSMRGKTALGQEWRREQFLVHSLTIPNMILALYPTSHHRTWYWLTPVRHKIDRQVFFNTTWPAMKINKTYPNPTRSSISKKKKIEITTNSLLVGSVPTHNGLKKKLRSRWTVVITPNLNLQVKSHQVLPSTRWLHLVGQEWVNPKESGEMT